MAASVQALGSSRLGSSTNQIVGSSSFISSQTALPLLRTPYKPLAKHTLTVCATPNDKEDSATDWDTAWSTFKKGVEAQAPKSKVGTKPPRFSNGSSGNWNAGPMQNEIKKQERTLLDIWTKESFSQLSIVAVILLLIALVVVGGDIPKDDRCTLPWC